MTEPLVQLVHVSKTFSLPNITVLRDIHLTLRRGESLSIVGASGSGKSTLLNLLGLLDTFDSGDYTLAGHSVIALDATQRAQRRNRYIGFIFQAFFLLPRLSVLENVCLPCLYRHESMTLAREKALNILERVGMADYHAQRPQQLSGGQQQRVAIARALVSQPLLLLADEPTGALDRATGEHILELFLTLQHEQHMSLVLVTHDATIAARSERVLTVEDGQLWE